MMAKKRFMIRRILAIRHSTVMANARETHAVVDQVLSIRCSSAELLWTYNREIVDWPSAAFANKSTCP
jgi:hypothetical protein